jgi:hypothetical protein
LASLTTPRDEVGRSARRDLLRLQLLWLTCAAVGFTVTAAVSCVLAVVASVAVTAP